MGRAAGLVLILAATAGFAGRAQAAPSSACFWVHGRLSAYNGTPTFRIWPLGTRRILGVADDGLPLPVQARVSPDAFKVDLFGDYHVCPLRPDRPGRMRFVRLDRARRLVVRPHGAFAMSAGRTPP